MKKLTHSNFFPSILKMTLSSILFLILSGAVSIDKFQIDNMQSSNQDPYYEIVEKIRDIQEYYLSSPDASAGNTFKERIINRNIAIKAVFSKFRETKKEEYTRQSFYKDKTITCTSTTGKTKRCYDDMTVNPEDHWFVESSIVVLPGGNGLISGPTLSQKPRNKISFGVSKAGEGSNTITVRAAFKYREPKIKALIKNDIDQIRKGLNKRNLPSDLSLDPN